MAKEKLYTQSELKTYAATLIRRAALAYTLGKQFGGDRDTYEVLGYDATLDFNKYWARYVRQDIASRIVDMPAKATWRNIPELLEEKEREGETDFEREWEALNRRLKVIHYFERVDRLAGIGQYAILLIGVANTGKLETPLTGRIREEDLAYLRPYSEGSAPIERFVENPDDPRFGHPDLYRVKLTGDTSENTKMTQARDVLVHHSRVIHVAEDLLEDNVFGTPRLRPIYNLLDDLVKVVGGGAEMFWQGAYRGLHMDVKPDSSLGQLGDDEMDDLAEEVDEYIHGIRRFIRTQGVDIKPLEVELGNPQYAFDVIMNLISGTTGIPKRILIGSERGELASTQDEKNWGAYVRERRDEYAEPIILRPFIDKLMDLGALPKPADGYIVKWPDISQLTRVQEAQIAESYARAVRFASGNKARKEELIVTQEEFREHFLGLPPKPKDRDLTPTSVDSEEDVESEEEGQEVVELEKVASRR